VKEKCLKTQSEYRERRCRCNVWWKTVPELAPETGKAHFPTVERLNGGTASWLEEADRSLCRDGTSVTRVKYDDRYAGALFTINQSKQIYIVPCGASESEARDGRD